MTSSNLSLHLSTSLKFKFELFPITLQFPVRMWLPSFPQIHSLKFKFNFSFAHSHSPLFAYLPYSPKIAWTNLTFTFIFSVSLTSWNSNSPSYSLISCQDVASTILTNLSFNLLALSLSLCRSLKLESSSLSSLISCQNMAVSSPPPCPCPVMYNKYPRPTARVSPWKFHPTHKSFRAQFHLHNTYMVTPAKLPHLHVCETDTHKPEREAFPHLLSPRRSRNTAEHRPGRNRSFDLLKSNFFFFECFFLAFKIFTPSVF